MVCVCVCVCVCKFLYHANRSNANLKSSQDFFFLFFALFCCLNMTFLLCSFIEALRQKLEAAFPETKLNVNNSEIDSLVHVHFKDFNYIVEYTPLLVTYFVLLLYIYFSVRECNACVYFTFL